MGETTAGELTTMINKDLRVLMEAAGISLHARDKAPREVLLEEVVPVVRQMRQTIRDVVFALQSRETDLDSGIAHSVANEHLVDRIVQVIDRWTPATTRAWQTAFNDSALKDVDLDMNPEAAAMIVDLMMQDAEMRGAMWICRHCGMPNPTARLNCQECLKVKPSETEKVDRYVDVKGILGAVVCCQCGAVVARQATETHDVWHEKIGQKIRADLG